MGVSEQPVAVVTGGARGIGASIARKLCEEGRYVSIWDIDGEVAHEQVATLRDDGYTASYQEVDVSDPGSVEHAVERTVENYGRIDILVNNAGIAGTSTPIWEKNVSDWEGVIDVSLNGVFYSCNAVLPVILERERGWVVNIASIAGKEGNPRASAYSSAKAGVIGLTKSMGKELGEKNVIVNCVTPAVIETGMLDQVSDEQL
jgi:3-oxoacyl-[acyl-carrier protein] reductase